MLCNTSLRFWTLGNFSEDSHSAFFTGVDYEEKIKNNLAAEEKPVVIDKNTEVALSKVKKLLSERKIQSSLPNIVRLPGTLPKFKEGQKNGRVSSREKS